jgi:ribosome recycling factor
MATQVVCIIFALIILMATVNEMLTQLKDQLEKNLSHTHQEFSRIRAGKASPNMLDGVMVEYYGAPTPLSQVANVGTPDARTLAIQPWDKSLIRPIETAIINSNLGFAPQNDGEMIRINVPALTEERRKDLVKMAKAEAENSKVGIRNIRKDFMEKVKSMQKDGLSEDEARGAEEEIQKTIDNYIKKTEEVLSAKEKEIMTV